MTDAERIRQGLFRMRAAAYRAEAAKCELAAVAVGAAAALRGFVETFQAAVDRDVAEHPDLAELNVTMDGFYS